MKTSLGSIGELFPDKNIRCRVRGCTNSWQMAGEEAVRLLASSDPELPERMCEECYQAYLQLKDVEVPCSKPGCEAHWRWSRFQQLEARIRGHRQAPRRLCADCQKQMSTIADREMACRMKGCDQIWVWSRQQQMTWEKESPPTRLCDRCFTHLKRYAEPDLPCRVRGCQNTWTWSAYQQLEYELAGKDSEQPPRRMCRDCVRQLRDLQDRHMPCKVRECQRTWHWSAYAQLEWLLAGGNPEEPPTRLCGDCFNFFSRVQDVQRPCKIKGCRKTWIYGKGWQLRDWLKGREYPPAMMCADCTTRLAELNPLATPCTVPGCENTWTYEPLEQLKDRVSGRRELRGKRCRECEMFLHDHAFETLVCEACGCPIPWSPYEQLLVARGTFSKPALCSTCAGDNLPPSRPAVSLAADHHHVVRMPKGGRWGSDPDIAAWPPHLDHETIARAEKADLRIVALGDDLTYSASAAASAWPTLLEARLNQELADEARSVVVVNAGIPGTNSRQGLVRLARDVLPFKPDIVLFSFAYGDSILELNGDRWREKITPEEAEKAMAKLAGELLASGAKILYWTSNPMFPNDRAPAPPAEWATAQEARKSRILAHAVRVCADLGIPVLELRARFEVNGKTSARKWMVDWLNHNHTGANNIATWMTSELLARHIERE